VVAIYRFFCFASVRALSQYTTEELVRMGIDGLWIGVEGRRSGYAKQAGTDIATLFGELRQSGIMILASMILGFDYQTPEIIQEELDYLIAQKPTLSQFLIYGPTPGTPFYDRIMKEKRLREDMVEDREYYFHQSTGFDAMVTHPTLSPQELRQQQQRCFSEDFKSLGPSIIRSVECYLNGYLRWRNHPEPLIRKKAQGFRRDFIKSVVILPAAIALGPSLKARKFAWKIFVRGIKECDIPLSVWLRFMVIVPLSFPAALWTKIQLDMNLFQHPRLKATYYPGNQLQPLCGRLESKKSHNWLEVQLESLEMPDESSSLKMLRIKGILDNFVLKEFFKRLHRNPFANLKNSVIDLRDLEFLNQKSFIKFLKGFNRKNIKLSFLVTKDMMNWWNNSTLELKENIRVSLIEGKCISYARG